MGKAITAAGYIITDGDLIHGVGVTADAAWSDMRRTMDDAGIALIADDEDSGDHLGSWARESSFKCYPSTQALIDQVTDRGGDGAWAKVQGVACTRDEADEGEV